MLHVIRLETVHPLLVHFTLGGFAIIILAYLMALWRRSSEWTRVGDVALVTTASITFATFTFGLVANATVPWPGGVQLWRWLHLGFGAFLTAALGVLATIRLARASRRPVTGAATAGAVIGVAILAAWTGWMGGEVLVYRAGMAVQAAGNGSLAPPVVTAKGAPSDMNDGMDRIRASWGSATSHLALMVVQHPSPSGFAAVARDGESLGQTARWLADITRTSSGDQGFSNLAQKLVVGATQLQQSANKSDLEQATRSTADIEGTCAACHQQFRWR